MTKAASNASNVPPLSLPLAVDGSGSPSNTMCLWSTRVYTPNKTSLRSAVFAQRSHVTDRQFLSASVCLSVCRNGEIVCVCTDLQLSV